MHAVHGLAELLRDRRIWIVWTEVRIVGFVSVGAPVPLVLARIGVEYDHAPVSVPVRNKGFVRCLINNDIGGHVDVLEIIAVLLLIRAAELQ